MFDSAAFVGVARFVVAGELFESFVLGEEGAGIADVGENTFVFLD